MPRHPLLIVSLALMCAGVLFAEDKPEEKLRGPAPQLMLVDSMDAETGVVVLEYAVLEQVTREGEYKTIVDGKLERTPVTVILHESQSRTKRLTISSISVFTAGMEKLKTAEALKQLKPGMMVAVHSGNATLDLRYLQRLKDDTLILVTKREPPHLREPFSSPALVIPPTLRRSLD